MLGHVPRAAQFYAEGVRADCEVGASLTPCLRLPDDVVRAVPGGFERFDGRGGPPAARPGYRRGCEFAAVGYAAAMFDGVGGGAVAAETGR
jgi:hypothetical protein